MHNLQFYVSGKKPIAHSPHPQHIKTHNANLYDVFFVFTLNKRLNYWQLPAILDALTLMWRQCNGLQILKMFLKFISATW